MLQPFTPLLTVSGGASSGSVSELVFSNSNGVSFGLSRSTITASVNTSYLASNASTNYVQANAVFNGTNASGTIASNAISVSVAAQSLQAAVNALGVSNTGNTAGNTGTSSGITFAIAGSNNITASQSTVGGGPNTIWLSGPTLTQYLTTAMQSNAATISNINISAGATSNNLSAVTFSNSNGVSFGLSASTITASVAAQSNQSAIKGLGASNTGNTAGNTGLSTGIDWVIAGSNNITISESTAGGGPNTLWISGPTVGGNQTGISSIAAAGGTQTVGMVSFVNSNGVTFGMSTGANTGTITASVAAQSVQPAVNAIGVSNTGNTAGNTGTSSGITFVIAGSNNITASQSTVGGGPDTIWLSGPTLTQYLTTAALSGDTTKYVENWNLTGNTAGTTSSAQGNNLWFSGGNSVTVSGSSNTIVISVGNYITTADLSQNSSNYARNWKLTGNTAGTTSSAIGTDLWIAGGNNITVSGSSNSITISGANVGGAQTGISGIIASNTTFTSGTVSLSASTNITISSSANGATQYAIFSVGNYITTADLSQNSSNYFRNWKLTGNTAGTSSSAQGTDFWLGGGNGVTLSGSSNTISISVATSYLASNASSNYMQNWKLTGNTAGTTSSAEGTDLWFGGGNGVTLSGSSNTISISVATSYLASNASTNYVQANAVFNGTNASGTIASNAISVSVLAQSNQTLGVYVSGTTAGQSSSSTFDARSVTISGFGPMSLGESSSSIFISLAGALYQPLYAFCGGI